MKRFRSALAALLPLSVLMAGMVTSACGTVAASDTIRAVGAENEYSSVISQVGGSYVSVTSIMSNPNTDPHTFESSASTAETVDKAQLVVQNGVGYDTFMNTIEAATPNASRKVIDVQKLLGLPNSTENPHLWYNPDTMPAVARAVASDLSSLDPSHAATFTANANAFIASLAPWNSAIASLKASHAGFPVAVTEPVSDYLLTALGADDRTPWAFQADIMNGVDPSPQDIALEQNLFATHEVDIFVYNQQVVDPLTTSLRELALKDGVPVVGVYETMPTPGYTYQTWMMAEVKAIRDALTEHTSTQRL